MTATTQQPEGRKQWAAKQPLTAPPWECRHCGLKQSHHIRYVFCPEWRLRQLDGDR